jgi:pimeloyl-ACP methyl ester carboxylesterase
VTSAGIGLAYDDTGGADRPVVVLLHALGEQRSSWVEVVPALAARYRVLSFDLRGHGASDWPGTYSFRLMCEDLLDALDRLGLDRVTLVGHSMGGVVCYLAAIARPDLVERLVVEDAPPPYERSRPIPERPPEDLPFDWAVVPAIVTEVGAGSPTLWEQLASIEAPTLLIGGGPDSHVPQDKLVDVTARIPQCTLVTIPAGHEVHAERPAEFTRTVLEWLDPSSPPSPP